MDMSLVALVTAPCARGGHLLVNALLMEVYIDDNWQR